MNEVYVLVADRTDTVIATGTYEQCEFARAALIAYGIAVDRTFTVPKEHFDNSNREASDDID